MTKRQNCEFFPENTLESVAKKLKIDTDENDFIPKSPEYAPEYYTPQSPTYAPGSLQQTQYDEPDYMSAEHLYNLSKKINHENLKTIDNNSDQIYGHDFYRLGEFLQEPNYNSSIILPQQPMPHLIVNNNMDCDVDMRNEETKFEKDMVHNVIANTRFTNTSRPYISVDINFSHIPRLCNVCMSLSCIC